MTIVREEAFSGPLPHPRHFERYEEILPGSADRILSMAESALNHNMKVSESALAHSASDARLGQILGFGALVLLIAGATVSILIGSEVGAGLFLGTGALGVIGLFVKRQLFTPKGE